MNPHRDRDMEEVRALATHAEDAVNVLRERVWSMMRKDPAYSLVVLNGLKAVARELHRSAIALDMGLDMLADVHTIESSGVA